MRPVLFDSSVYIAALRGDQTALLGLRRLQPASPIWLSSVVLEELFAGAAHKDGAAIERLERDFGKIRRILVPNLSDWAQTGKMLAKLGIQYGHEGIGQGRLTNDALIAVSAGRVGITVITKNWRDFERLAEFCRFTLNLV